MRISERLRQWRACSQAELPQEYFEDIITDLERDEAEQLTRDNIMEMCRHTWRSAYETGHADAKALIRGLSIPTDYFNEMYDYFAKQKAPAELAPLANKTEKEV
jgi:hypothetical protein